ncbi:MAG: hypothetical protein KF688_19285 [Pirellulales bacterium]|nr:hypothetical protein [Pirellulales bacterium]
MNAWLNALRHVLRRPAAAAPRAAGRRLAFEQAESRLALSTAVAVDLPGRFDVAPDSGGFVLLNEFAVTRFNMTGATDALFSTGEWHDVDPDGLPRDPAGFQAAGNDPYSLSEVGGNQPPQPRLNVILPPGVMPGAAGEIQLAEVMNGRGTLRHERPERGLAERPAPTDRVGAVVGESAERPLATSQGREAAFEVAGLEQRRIRRTDQRAADRNADAPDARLAASFSPWAADLAHAAASMVPALPAAAEPAPPAQPAADEPQQPSPGDQAAARNASRETPWPALPIDELELVAGEPVATTAPRDPAGDSPTGDLPADRDAAFAAWGDSALPIGAAADRQRTSAAWPLLAALAASAWAVRAVVTTGDPNPAAPQPARRRPPSPRSPLTGRR